ncbi:hypothetical protein [Mesorhizobium sp. IMUNJ 23232]|uniref:hypothetical protein n=1 Tax=Mesorhizobium sp. IMUNJ 23232 TaxID=3376064 RepID=UPI0037BAF59B
MFTAKVFVAALIIFCALTQARAGSPDYCDDKIELGESPDGKVMMMMSMMARYLLAEEYCGAKPEPLAKVFVVVELAHGCGPRSKLEAEAGVKEGLIANPKQRQEVLELVFPEIKSHTKQEVVAMMEQELGGCSDLLNERQEVLKRYNQ